jgi:hypothetical protein
MKRKRLENFAKKVRTCRLPFPETRSLISIMIMHFLMKAYSFESTVTTVNLGFKLKTEQLQIVEMFWQVFSYLP